MPAFLFIILVAAIGLCYLGWLLFSVVKLRKHLEQKRQYEKDRLIRVHMISETEWVTQGQGVHTAFIELCELLQDDHRIRLAVNDHGTGMLFHSHTYGPYYFWKGLGYKGRRILTAHVIPDSSKGTIPFWKQLLPLTSRYLKLVYSYADVIIAISPTVEKAVRDLGVSAKIVRIYNPVLVENWASDKICRQQVRQKLGIAEDEFVVLGVGQLQERKGVDDFIDMATAMPDFKFVWVGGRPWGRFTEGVQRIDKKIENATPNVIFAGLLDVKDMPPMYAMADLFLSPSYQENCPLAPLEAATAGLPVIFRDIPEYRSLYQSPYLRARDTPEFIHLTRRMASSREYYDQGVMVSKKLIGEFDKDRIKEQIIRLYKDTLSDYFND